MGDTYATERTEADAVAEHTARPFPVVETSSDGLATTITALPPGWTSSVENVRVKEAAPSRPKSNTEVRTAAGFVREIARLGGDRVPAIYANSAATKLVAHVDPTTLDCPTYDDVRVSLVPNPSEELVTWTRGTPMSPTAWAAFIEDNAMDVSIGERNPSPAELIADAQNWVTEVRRLSKQVRSDPNATSEDAEEVVARSVHKVIPRFEITVPVLVGQTESTLVVRLDRDIPGKTITPVVVGAKRLICSAERAECVAALELGGWTAVL